MICICVTCLSCQKESEEIISSEPIASDQKIYKFTGDFDGNGFSDLAFWNSQDGTIWFGLYDGTAMVWKKVYENSEWKAVPVDPGTFKFTGNYIDPSDEKTKTYLGFWYYGDGNIWIAKYNGDKIIWNVAGIKKYYEE